MSSVAKINDGQVVNNTSTTAATSANSKNGSTLDKDAFLQLLVAQMKYQDPLEPTSNTEYVAQYATFSQVESLQNMSTSMENQNALTLVGKYVTMDVQTASGSTTTVSGRVDYVEKTGDDTYLYINGTPYNYANLNTVWDGDYLEAYELCGSWSKSINELPSVDKITLDYADSISALRDTYDKMTPYQKSFIGSSLTDILKAAEAKIEALRAAQKNKETGDDKPEEDKTDLA